MEDETWSTSTTQAKGEENIKTKIENGEKTSQLPVASVRWAIVAQGLNFSAVDRTESWCRVDCDGQR